MGMEIKLFNKNAAQAEIAKEKERTARHISDNETTVKTNSNKTNLIEEIAKGLVSLVGTIFGGSNSNKEE